MCGDFGVVAIKLKTTLQRVKVLERKLKIFHSFLHSLTLTLFNDAEHQPKALFLLLKIIKHECSFGFS